MLKRDLAHLRSVPKLDLFGPVVRLLIWGTGLEQFSGRRKVMLRETASVKSTSFRVIRHTFLNSVLYHVLIWARKEECHCWYTSLGLSRLLNISVVYYISFSPSMTGLQAAYFGNLVLSHSSTD